MATRTQRLAQPKHNHLRSPDRRSVYWLDKLPQQRTESATKIELTPLWSDLARSKKFYNQVVISPIWEVSRWALRAEPSERLCVLAQPRGPAAGWQPERPLPTPVSKTRQKISLARSYFCQSPKQNHHQWEGARPACWPVSRAARSCVASQRLVQLSCPKTRTALCAGYDPNVVSRAALSARPSPRIQELSLPLPRKCTSRE
ncbi:theg spermatid protein [Nematolebias whitei]|uniref:theg spermatid protein n=1 Tax=Nematolebias whitei TaxID=451745 RepID=UPI00189C10D3|nr:theg spermatid protein [Nematolebias whitei]